MINITIVKFAQIAGYGTQCVLLAHPFLPQFNWRQIMKPSPF